MNLYITIITLAILLSLVSIRSAKLKLMYRQSTGDGIFCAQPLYTGTILENSQPGTFVLRVAAQNFLGIGLQWSIPDPSVQKFTINSANGDISVSSSLLRFIHHPRRLRAFVEFGVRASEINNPNNFCESNVRINVIPSTPLPSGIISAAMLFAQPSYQFTIGSCTPGSVVGQVSAQPISTDRQAPMYSIFNGNQFYTINPTSGTITVSGTPPPTGSQTISIMAQSGNGQSMSVPVTINSSCGGSTQSPVSTVPSYQFTITDCNVGATVGQVAIPALSMDRQVASTYAIRNGNGYFIVNPQTGLISLGLPNPPAGTQTYLITAEHPNGQPVSFPVTITSRCTPAPEPQLNQQNYQFTITDCSVGAAVGQVVLPILSMDRQVATTYTIRNGNGFFNINPQTGVISLAQANPPAGTQTYLITAEHPNGQPVSFPVTITSSCAAVSPGPQPNPQSSYQFTTTSCTAGSAVGQVSSQALSMTRQGVTYSLFGGNANYQINPQTGLISLSTGSTPSGTQMLSVVAQTGNGQTLSFPVYITSNCGGLTTPRPPQQYQLTTSSCSPGSAVGQVSAPLLSMDRMTPTYSLANGNQYYVINSQTGLISIMQPPPTGTQTLTVVAQTGNGPPTSVQVTITSNCAGTNPGSGSGIFWQSSYSFTSNVCSGSSTVGQVFTQATGQVSYFLPVPNPYFTIASQTGIITAIGPFPQGTATYTFLVSAVSSDGESGCVPVTVTNTCIGGPSSNVGGVSFTQPSYQLVSSQCQPGSIVGQVSAQGAGQTVTYSMSGGNSLFAVDPITGEVNALKPLPIGTWSQSFTVTATTTSGQSTSVPVAVSNTCTGSSSSTGGGFNQSSYMFPLPLCSAGSVVGTVQAFGSGGSIVYTILNGNPYFSINPVTGQIFMLQLPPGGTQTFIVQAVTLTGQVFTVPVTVTSGGGTVPTTTPSSSVPPNTFLLSTCAVGAFVGQVSYNSASGMCGTRNVYYRIIGAGSSFYAINQHNGVITLLAIPPYGTNTITVQAVSPSGPTVTFLVTITSSCNSGGGEPGDYGGMQSYPSSPYGYGAPQISYVHSGNYYQPNYPNNSPGYPSYGTFERLLPYFG